MDQAVAEGRQVIERERLGRTWTLRSRLSEAVSTRFMVCRARNVGSPSPLLIYRIQAFTSVSKVPVFRGCNGSDLRQSAKVAESRNVQHVPGMGQRQFVDGRPGRD